MVKKSILIGALFLITLLTTSIISRTSLHPDEGELLCLDYNNYDLGVRYLNDADTFSFPFTNCSGQWVSIESIQSNNKYDQNPFWILSKTYELDSIPPGKRDSIVFCRRLYHKIQPGLYDASFTITYKDSNIKQHLNIFCEYKANAGVLVAETVLVDTVERGIPVRFSAIVKNEGLDPVLIQKQLYPNNAAKIVTQLPLVIMPNTKKRLDFELETTNLNKYYKEYVELATNDDPDQARLIIRYNGALISDNEPVMEFDSLVQTAYRNYGEELTYHFNFTNIGTAPLIISSCKTSCGCLVASWPREPIEPGESNVIKIKYDTHRIGPINKSCTVQTNAPGGTILLRVKGEVKKCDE